MSPQPISVRLDVPATDVTHAIRTAGDLLVRGGHATSSYVDAMVQGFQELGPYIVIAPGVAMPHARPEAGARGTALAVLRLARPVTFGHPQNDPVRVVIPIVAVDPGAHIELLRALSSTLVRPGAMDTLLASDDPEEITALFTSQEGTNQ